MGEKIRDLHSIKIGSSELMIELNEGNTKAEGHLIHVQNKHFRFCMLWRISDCRMDQLEKERKVV